MGVVLSVVSGPSVEGGSLVLFTRERRGRTGGHGDVAVVDGSHLVASGMKESRGSNALSVLEESRHGETRSGPFTLDAFAMISVGFTRIRIVGIVVILGKRLSFRSGGGGATHSAVFGGSLAPSPGFPGRLSFFLIRIRFFCVFKARVGAASASPKGCHSAGVVA
jgi:hypothetical protein